MGNSHSKRTRPKPPEAARPGVIGKSGDADVAAYLEHIGEQQVTTAAAEIFEHLDIVGQNTLIWGGRDQEGGQKLMLVATRNPELIAKLEELDRDLCADPGSTTLSFPDMQPVTPGETTSERGKHESGQDNNGTP